MSHRHLITVRGFHCDLYGHVNNARYLEFLEEARWAYTEVTPALGAMGERGLGFVVASINIQYKRPAGLGMVLEILTSVTAFQIRRAVFQQRVIEAATGRSIAEAEVTFALIELANGRAVALTDEMRGWFSSTPGEGPA